ncbi:hypothetical protein [Rhizobium miluonense]|jgi:hypothetical protein|uniref:Uncharacterized protein n=1 Tax=Rhizobium miluonense TaxID=411945 RepID=A0ABU1SM20_9HYPH|nr:hypothetical protein [Rhizobium miluonense]MDR6900019.1 hypothetical protein [Rhizobium miluonense]
MESGKRWAITWIAGICFASGLSHLPLAAYAASKSLARPARHYCGKLLSSDRLVDVETSLQVDAKGHIAGTYRFNDDDETTVGTLSEIGTTPGRARTLRWFDKYGMGSLTIRFDAGYHRFEGLWGPQDVTPSYTWNGGSCNAPIS